MSIDMSLLQTDMGSVSIDIPPRKLRPVDVRLHHPDVS